jgi:hypothetical protein
MTATKPLRAVYVTGSDQDLIENGRPPTSREPAREIDRKTAPRASRERVDLATVIDEFMQAAEAGELEDFYGMQYRRDDLRELHIALTHVKSELGAMQIESVRRWQVQGMLDELRRVGLPPARLTTVVDALHSVYGYAIERGLVDDSPVIWLTFPQRDAGTRELAPQSRPRLRETPAASPVPVPSEPVNPTEAMLALGSRVLLWTIRIVVTIFVLIAILLIVEFA